jgi:hypothetical protein
MMSNTIETAIAPASRLGGRLSLAEWLVIGEGLAEARSTIASDKVYGAWVKANIPFITGFEATAARNCFTYWAEIEPYTQPGQPLAKINNPRRLWEAFKALTEAEETPAAEVVRVVKEIPATATVDSLAEYLEAFARDTGTSVDEARLLIDGLRLDLASRASSSPLAIVNKVVAAAR